MTGERDPRGMAAHELLMRLDLAFDRTFTEALEVAAMAARAGMPVRPLAFVAAAAIAVSVRHPEWARGVLEITEWDDEARAMFDATARRIVEAAPIHLSHATPEGGGP